MVPPLTADDDELSELLLVVVIGLPSFSSSFCCSETIKSNTLKTEDYKVEYALLPVYMVNVKYAGKMYTFAMNGQTGEFIGDIPTDKRKALLLFIAIFCILFMILLGVSYIIYKVGV